LKDTLPSVKADPSSDKGAFYVKMFRNFIRLLKSLPAISTFLV
jgi:hypothetical protein